jgi:hypothetical protein
MSVPINQSCFGFHSEKNRYCIFIMTFFSENKIYVISKFLIEYSHGIFVKSMINHDIHSCTRIQKKNVILKMMFQLKSEVRIFIFIFTIMNVSKLSNIVQTC